MTISYTLDIATTNSLSFLKILFRWKGSVWKNSWREFSLWIAAYFLIYNIIQHEHVSPELQRTFANLIHHLDDKLVYIPLVLLLGFFVTFVVDRWKNIFINMGFIDNVAFTVSNYITGSEESVVIARRNILRYLCASQVLVLRDISLKVRKRFPNMTSLLQAGYLQDHELKILKDQKTNTDRYVVPINWACSLVLKMQNAGNIGSETLIQAIFKEICDYQKQLQTLCNFDYVPVPLAYPQIAFCVVRAYLLICLVARQYVVETPGEPKPTATIETLAMSLMTMLQVFFYLAWVKVAEELLNPLGEDDDDLECNFVIDYNTSIAFKMADNFNGLIPEQTNEEMTKPKNVIRGYRGSASRLNLNKPTHMIPHNPSTPDSDAPPSIIETDIEAEPPSTVRVTRRLTFPLSFKKRNENLQMEVPAATLAKQSVVQTIDAEQIYKRHPTQSQAFYDNNSFSETFSYHPRPTSFHHDDEPHLFAKSHRFI